MIPENMHMCRFYLNGEPEMGEYVQLDDGTGICHIPDMNDEGKTIIVSYPDGTMPDGISDLELIDIPFSIDYDSTASVEDIIPADVRERMSKTNLILEEYEAGMLDEREAGEALFNHLFGKRQNHEEPGQDKLF